MSPDNHPPNDDGSGDKEPNDEENETGAELPKPEEDKDTEEQSDEEDDESRTITNPFNSWIYTDFQDHINNFGIRDMETQAIKDAYKAANEITEVHNQRTRAAILKAAQIDMDIDFGKAILQLTQGLEDLEIAVEANHALARSINPDIFKIQKDLEKSAAIDLYETVAALNQLETQARPDDKTHEKHVELIPPGASDTFEEDVLELVAREVVTNDEFSEESQQLAVLIIETSSLVEKRNAFNKLFEYADEKTETILEATTRSATWVGARIWFVFVYLFMPRSTDE